MPLSALGLLLIAAFMHAAWNLAVKQAKYKRAFIWLALAVGSLSSLLFLLLQGSFALPVLVWPYALSSAIVEMIYYVALTWAYDCDDFSLTYPVARGTAPALLALWATLFLHEAPRPVGLLGIALLIVGLIVVGGGSALWHLGRTTFSVRGILAALVTACCISVFSAIDGAAVHLFPAPAYTVLVLTLTALLLAPMMIVHHGPRLLLEEWQANWWRMIVVGLLVVLAYGLVLHVYSFVRISYAGAIREVSIVFAAIAGWHWLGEKFGIVRTIGAIVIFAGIVVIAFFGLR